MNKLIGILISFCFSVSSLYAAEKSTNNDAPKESTNNHILSPAVREVLTNYFAFGLKENSILTPFALACKSTSIIVQNARNARQKIFLILPSLYHNLAQPNPNLPVFRDLTYGRSVFVFEDLFRLFSAHHSQKETRLFDKFVCVMRDCDEAQAEYLFQAFLPALMTATANNVENADIDTLSIVCQGRNFQQWMDFIEIKLRNHHDAEVTQLCTLFDHERRRQRGRAAFALLAPQIRRSLFTHGFDFACYEDPTLDSHVNFFSLASMVWNGDQNPAQPLLPLLSLPAFQYLLRSNGFRRIFAQPLEYQAHHDLILRNFSSRFQQGQETSNILFEFLCFCPHLVLSPSFNLMTQLAAQGDENFTPERIKRFEEKIQRYEALRINQRHAGEG